MATILTPKLTVQDDGRSLAAYLVSHCLCRWCWGLLVERFDEEGEPGRRWYASCAEWGSLHQGFHQKTWVERVKIDSRLEAVEIIGFYRETEWAESLGIKRKEVLTPEERLKLGRQRLGRDGGGID